MLRRKKKKHTHVTVLLDRFPSDSYAAYADLVNWLHHSGLLFQKRPKCWNKLLCPYCGLIRCYFYIFSLIEIALIRSTASGNSSQKNMNRSYEQIETYATCENQRRSSPGSGPKWVADIKRQHIFFRMLFL